MCRFSTFGVKLYCVSYRFLSTPLFFNFVFQNHYCILAGKFQLHHVARPRECKKYVALVSHINLKRRSIRFQGYLNERGSFANTVVEGVINNFMIANWSYPFQFKSDSCFS